MSFLAIQVTGIPEQIIRFKALTEALQPVNIGEIINFALSNVESEAQGRAPVLTGRLRDSIVHYMLNEFSGECIALAPYANAQENGFTTSRGANIPGKHYFMPAAIHGAKILTDEMNKYIAAVVKGLRPTVPRGDKGSRGGGGGVARSHGQAAHKYLQKISTGAGFRYVYAKTTAPSKFRFQGKPGIRKQPSTHGQRRKPGRRR